MRKTDFGRVLMAVAMVSLAWAAAWAQPQLPATITVPVTFYDFRSDRSNPEFEQPHRGGRHLGMVANTLDADNKPVATGGAQSQQNRNMGVAHWFRNWETYTRPASVPENQFFGRGSHWAPVYDPTPGIRQEYSNEWNATVTFLGYRNVGHDTSFKNIMIPGSLTFSLINATTGMYEFGRRGNNGFFPLDNQGFGNEWVAVSGARGRHNFAFTMELEFQFQVRPNMVFNFAGDDDVWVFIDNRLVLDIGGIHEEIRDNLDVISVLGAGAVGSHRTLRVFYAERHSEGSNITITTNIIAPPASIGISTTGNTTGTGLVTGTIDKPADQTTTLYSVVYDDMGRIMNPGQYNCDHVSWTIGGRVVGTGCSIEIADSIAGNLTIVATYNDRQNPPVNRTIGMNVRALPPAAIHIQTSPEPKIPGPGVRLSDDVYFNPGQSNASVYAILTDRYGNFVGLANNVNQSGANNWYSQGAAQWTTEDSRVATTNPSAGANVTVNKEFMGEGTESKIIVSYTACGGTLTGCVTLTDTVAVGSRSVGQIAVGPNPFIPGVTSVVDMYAPNTLRFYDNVIKNSTGGAGKGVLIAVDAPKPLTPAPGGSSGSVPGVTQYGRVMIYDAVGNVVRREALYQADGASRSYGFVWDGKNQRGRYVGPGTYLVHVTGRDVDGTNFSVRRKVGVKK